MINDDAVIGIYIVTLYIIVIGPLFCYPCLEFSWWQHFKFCDFQLSFIYPYADNNWVKIYVMSGKEVFSVDMPYDNPNIIVDLPDGMYKVKTFHDQIAPIKEFVIGKP